MRDILTGLAIVLILVLTGALVGPFFIDWTQYRVDIEQALEKRLGVPVRVRGDILVRALPAPRVSLGKVELRDHGADRPMVEIERLDFEVAVAPLLRGELRVVEAGLTAPRLAFDALHENAGGARLALYLGQLSPNALAIDKLVVRDAVLLPDADAAATGAAVRVSGEFVAAALIGPWRGQGEVTVADRTLTYSLSTGVAEPGRLPRVKLLLDDILTAARIEFEGSASLTQNPGRPLAFDGRIVASGAATWLGRLGADAPTWKVTALGATAGMVFESRKVEIEAGRDGLIKLEGGGRLDMSRGLLLALDVSTGQVDIDRVLDAFAHPGERLDVSALVARVAALPFALEAKLGLERLLASGEAHGPFAARLRAGLGRLEVEDLELDLAAQTRLRLSASVLAGDRAVARGELRITSGDPARAAVALLHLKGGDPIVAALHSSGPSSLAGKFLLDGDGLLLNGAEWRFGETRVSGDAKLRPARGQDRTRLEARLTASQLDLDLLALLAPEAGAPIDLTLALDASNARAALFGARDLGRLSLRLRTSARVLDIERLELLGQDSAKVAVFGRLDAGSGRITAEVDAEKFAPVLDLARPLLPPRAIALLAARAAMLSPARFAATFERRTADETTLRLVGSLAGVKLDADALLAGDPARTLNLETAKLMVEAPDGRVLLRQLGLPEISAEAFGRADLRFDLANKNGARQWTLESALGDVSLSASGNLARGDDIAGTGAIKVQAGDARGLLAAIGWPLAGEGAQVTVDLAGDLSLRETRLTATRLKGRLAGKPIGGSIALDLAGQNVLRLGGALEFERIALAELARVVAPGQFPALAGQRPGANAFPRFQALPLLVDLSIAAGRLDVAPALAAERVRFRLKADPSSFEIADGEADVARGRVTFLGRLRRDGGQFSLDGRLGLTAVDPALLLPRGLADGRVDASVEFATTGGGEAELVAGLGGGGEIAVRALTLPALDPGALRRTILSVNPDGEAPKADAFLARLAREFGIGAFTLGATKIPLVLAAGTMRFGPLNATTDGAALIANVSVNLASGARNGRAVLRLLGDVPEWSGAPPQVALELAGMLTEPSRLIDAATVLNAMTVRAVQREIARIEAIEADQRERSAQARLLRAFRDQDLREQELRTYLELETSENTRLARVREGAEAFTRAAESDRAAQLAKALALRNSDPEGLASELAQRDLTATVPADRPTAVERPRTVVLPLPPAAPDRRALGRRPFVRERAAPSPANPEAARAPPPPIPDRTLER